MLELKYSGWFESVMCLKSVTTQIYNEIAIIGLVVNDVTFSAVNNAPA